MTELAHPWFLLLALVLPWLWLAQRRSLADLTPAQRRTCIALRGFVLALLILALAGVRWLLPSRGLAVVFAIDHSASVSPQAREKARAFIRESLAHQQSGDVAGIVGFAGDAELWQPPVESARLLDRWPTLAAPNRTDISHALEFSAAMLPTGKQARIVLLTDGNDTSDRAAESAQSLGAKGCELFTVPLRNTATPEVLVERVDIPRRLWDPLESTCRHASLSIL